jgi:hypothetical protein
MPTLWEMLKKKVSPPVAKSKQIDNPLHAKIGSSVQFDVLDYRDMTFFVKEIHAVERNINGENHPFSDYMLLARPLGQDDIEAKLRLVPTTGDQTHSTLLLRKHDSLPFQQDFRDILNEEEFATNEDGVETGRYWRIVEGVGSYKTTAKIVTDKNENTEDPFGKLSVEYWDYWREFKDEAGADTKEYLFVEMEKENGFFTIWKGLEINAQRVDIR